MLQLHFPGLGAEARRNEFAIELVLLLGRQQGANADIGIDQHSPPLALKIASEPPYPGMSVLHHLADLLTL